MDPVRLVPPNQSAQDLEPRFEEALQKASLLKKELFQLGLLGVMVADRIEKIDITVMSMRQLRWEHKFHIPNDYGRQLKAEHDLSMYECFLDAEYMAVVRALTEAESTEQAEEPLQEPIQESGVVLAVFKLAI